MTIDFYSNRSATGEPIVSFDDCEIQVINSELSRKRVALSLDPYADVKLTDANVEQTLSLISIEKHAAIHGKLSKLKGIEVCYGFGD